MDVSKVCTSELFEAGLNRLVIDSLNRIYLEFPEKVSILQREIVCALTVG